MAKETIDNVCNSCKKDNHLGCDARFGFKTGCSCKHLEKNKKLKEEGTHWSICDAIMAFFS